LQFMSLNLIINVKASDIAIEMTCPEFYDYDIRYLSICGNFDHLGGV